MLNILVEEKEFYAQINEQIENVEKNGKIILTKFLSLREQEIVLESAKYHQIHVQLEGGILNSERKRCLLSEDYINANYNITCFKILYNKRYLKLTHQNVLGTLMSLKMDRSLFGDIVFIQDECYFFVSTDIEHLLLLEFKVINRVPISIERFTDKLTIIEKFITKEIIISSMRIDNLIGHVYNLSRESAKQYVSSGYVYKNDQLVTNPAMKCEVKDIISVRKHGRFLISELIRETKSNKLVLEIKIPTQ